MAEFLKKLTTLFGLGFDSKHVIEVDDFRRSPERQGSEPNPEDRLRHAYDDLARDASLQGNY